MVKAYMSHQMVMSNFPTDRMVGKVGLEVPVNAAKSSAETAASRKAIRQANNGNPAGQPAADKNKAAEQQAFADKLAKRRPPSRIERAERRLGGRP